MDDILYFYHDANGVLNKLCRFVPLKLGAVSIPNMYLDRYLSWCNYTMTYGQWWWAHLNISMIYLESLQKCTDELWWELQIAKLGRQFFLDYIMELDVFPMLGLTKASHYQSFIQAIRWMVEIVYTYINTKLFLLLSYVDMSREGHLKAAPHVMDYHKFKHKSCLAFDPTYPDIDYSNFKEYGWTYLWVWNEGYPTQSSIS